MNNIYTQQSSRAVQSTSSEHTQHVHAEDAQEFEKQLEKKDDTQIDKGEKKQFPNTSEAHKEARLKDKDHKEHKASPGDSILSGLLSTETRSAAQAEATTPLNKALPSEEILNKLVDSILVGTAENKQEVHIKIQTAVLADTTIQLCMEEGKLTVQLQTSNADSALTMHQNADNLQARLHNLCKDMEVDVKVIEQKNNTGGQSKQGENQGQSRGHFLWETDA